MASLREEKKAETRSAVAQAAAELVFNLGMEKVTISAIAKKARISPRTFHNYFSSQLEALDYYVREQVGKIALYIDEKKHNNVDTLDSLEEVLINSARDTTSGANNIFTAVVIGTQIQFLPFENKNQQVKPLYFQNLLYDESVSPETCFYISLAISTLAWAVMDWFHSSSGKHDDPEERERLIVNLQRTISTLRNGIPVGMLS